MRFDIHVGIDYSGAETAYSPLKGLQVYTDETKDDPVSASAGSDWSRQRVAAWIVSQGDKKRRSIVGIDHAFSLPASYLDRYGIRNWSQFLVDFCDHWPTHREGSVVRFIREGNDRTGTPEELRLTEKWTSSAKSIFQFVGPGVAHSTHAGIPWLADIRTRLRHRIHFWPFDGWSVAEGMSVIAEVYPALFRKRYPSESRSSHKQDAYAVSRWLREADERGILDHYFHPPLTEDEKRLAQREGWILGIC